MGRVLVCLAQGLSLVFKSTKNILEKKKNLHFLCLWKQNQSHMRDGVKAAMRSQNGASHQKWPCGIWSVTSLWDQISMVSSMQLVSVYLLIAFVRMVWANNQSYILKLRCWAEKSKSYLLMLNPLKVVLVFILFFNCLCCQLRAETWTGESEDSWIKRCIALARLLTPVL